MSELKLGVVLWPQCTSWKSLLDAAQRADRLGYDHLWTWDHLHSVGVDRDRPIFEAWSTLSAWAARTERTHLGLLCCCNTLRNPGLVAKQTATIDHISEGRAILGLGAGWFADEHVAHGIDFGSSPGERLTRLDEAVAIVRGLLAGETVTQHGSCYRFESARQAPQPLRDRVPIMIGGSGERKTLRTVAQYADMWNAEGTARELRGKDKVLRGHCLDVGRDETEIERTFGHRVIIRDDPREARRVWIAQAEANGVPTDDIWAGSPPLSLGPPEDIAASIREYQAVGFSTLMVEMAPPFDVETMERLIREVRPMVQQP